MAISRVSLVGSPRTANVRARAATAWGGLMAAIAWHTRSPSMTRWPDRSAGSRCTVQTMSRSGPGSAAFEVAFGLQVGLAQGGQRVGIGGVPELAVRCLQEAFGDAVQRPGVGAVEELAHLLVADVGIGELLVHPVFDHAGRRVVTEQVVHGGGEFERALVAVPFHRLDPA